MQNYIDSYPTSGRGRLEDHINTLGHTRIVCYEGGPSIEGNAYEEGKLSFQESPEMREAIEYFMQNSAIDGCRIYIPYNAHSKWETSQFGTWWGSMGRPGDNTQHKWLAYEAMAAAGGASKP